ncbi:MAG TPA: heme ABC exporter ATP-binding protein CcmA [Paracoccaceae bacterium]|nr:heme ABC exporter ATP-binding protein CcmA [Paracoccaceae bacterium]
MGLEATHLRIERGGRLVIEDLSFRLGPGETLMLRGPNGAGKSTLLRALAGLLPLAGGRVRLLEADLARERDRVQEHLAYSGHLDAVKPQLTLAENLAVWARLFGGDAAAALRRFGLERLADRPAAACSAGQRRRLGLARLLLAPRPLWLLDEPTVSLDSEAVGIFADLVRSHGAAGGMAVIATHVDLGLEGAAVLRIEPIEAEARHAADPFLRGDWA